MNGESERGPVIEYHPRRSVLPEPDAWALVAAVLAIAGFCGVLLVGATHSSAATVAITLVLLITSLGAAVLGVASAVRHKSSLFLPVMALVGAIPILLMLLGEVRQFRRHPCPSHLRQIGQALMLYAHDNGGRSPETLHELTTIVAHEVLVCPDDTDAGDGSTKTTYVYLKPRRPVMSLLADEVLAYEPLRVHETGANILFGDGHVEWISASAYDRILAEARAITQRLDEAAATRPATQATQPAH